MSFAKSELLVKLNMTHDNIFGACLFIWPNLSQMSPLFIRAGHVSNLFQISLLLLKQDRMQ